MTPREPAAQGWDTGGVLIDISVSVSAALPEWPGDVAFACGWTARIAQGDTVNLSVVTASPHVGTHADSPLHVRDGWPASETLPLHAFVGPVVVLDYPRGGSLSAESLDRALADTDVRLLLRTGRTIAEGVFPADWPVLPGDVAQRLVERRALLVGVDAPSVDARDSTTLPVHRTLLGGGCHLLENLDLRLVAPGRYDLIALPQRIEGLDAAPVRAALRMIR